MKHLEFYQKHIQDWENDPEDQDVFLCNRAREGEINSDLLQLFRPTPEECEEYNHYSGNAWGWLRGTPSGGFNEFRQTVVLLIAAMEGEL